VMDKRLGFGLLAVVALAAIFASGARSSSEEDVAHVEPATLESVEGSDLLRITLTESAGQRLNIQTTSVATGTEGGLVVPSAALIITPDGKHWVYTSPEPLVFQRHEITQVVEEDHQAYFSEGPSVGTIVVVTGVPELYGAEFGIGK